MNNLESTLNFLRRYRLVLVIGVGILITLLVASNYALVKIEVPEKDTAISIRPAEEMPWSALAREIPANKYRIVPSGNSSIHITSGDKETELQKNLRPFGLHKVSAKLTPQHVVDTAVHSSNTANCQYQTGGVVFVCREGRIFRIGKGVLDTEQAILPDLTLVGQPINYEAGILAFGSQKEGERLYFVSNASAQPIAGLSTFDNVSREDLIMSVSLDGSGRFVVGSPSTKKLWLFEGVSDRAPKAYNYSVTLKESTESVSFGVTKDLVTINYFTEDTSDQNEPHPPYTSTLAAIPSASGSFGEPIVHNISKVTSSRNSDGQTTPVGEGLFISKDINDTLFLLEVKKDRLTVNSVIYNVDSYAVVNKAMHYQQGNDIYTYDPAQKSSSLVAKSPNSRISALKAVGGQLMFTGVSDNARSTQSIYVVTSANRTKRTPFEVMPYSSADLPLINSRFKGRQLFFSIRLDSQSFDPDSTASTYSKTEYTLRKEVILRALQRDGLSQQDYKIYFKPGP